MHVIHAAFEGRLGREAKLLSLYEGGAHIALGYNSWAEYCQREFHMSNGRAYQLLQAARVIHQLTIISSPQLTSQVPESERLARELVPLLSKPQALDEARPDRRWAACRRGSG
jgi:hypothetical protein